MKRYIVLTLILGSLLMFTGCSSSSIKAKKGDDLPTIILFNREYISHNTSTDELPEGYALSGELTNEMANNTGLSGYEMYLNKSLNSLPHIYIYQEVSIAKNDNTSTTKWAYVKWALSE